MRKVLKIAVLIVVFTFVTGLVLPALVQAGQAPAKDPEKDKIVELLKLHLLLSRGEHGSFHDALEKLAKKYPNDADIKALADDHHEMMHKRMSSGEEAIDLLTQKYLLTGGD